MLDWSDTSAAAARAVPAPLILTPDNAPDQTVDGDHGAVHRCGERRSVKRHGHVLEEVERRAEQPRNGAVADD